MSQNKVIIGFVAALAVIAVSVGINVVVWNKLNATQREENRKIALPKSVNTLKAFEDFEVKYERQYRNSEARAAAFKIFEDNYLKIQEHNAKPNQTYTLGVNKFTDMHPEEFAKRFLGLKYSNQGRLYKKNASFKYSGATLPESIDWQKKGGVTPVKNQGHCGSCWSFSTTGALEGRWFAKTAKLVSLSERQFVDCDTTDKGCNGGSMDTAFEFAESNQICTEESYPYTDDNDQAECAEDSCTVGIPKGAITSFVDVTQGDENALKEALVDGPVSVAIAASSFKFQSYAGGVLTGCDGKELDHGVLAVGYGTEDGAGYFKVKNSWGPDWGLNGYVLLGSQNECGILSDSSFPVLAKEATAVSEGVSKAQQPEVQFV